MPYVYQHPRPSVAVDCVLFRLQDSILEVLLIKRARKPFRGKWALPGGFVQMNESLEQAARRELREETGIKRSRLQQFYTFGNPDRDPRGRVISVSHYALVKLRHQRVAAASDAAEVAWFPIGDLPALAFDHDEIITVALEHLRDEVRRQPVALELLGRKFTLSQLQKVYEAVLETSLDKRNFRRKLLDTGLMIELDETEQNVAHRAARLYRFDRSQYRKLARRGFKFEI